MAIDPFLVELLACPETRAPVGLAPPDLLGRLQAAAAKGTLKNRAGRKVERMDAALVRQDGAVAYPVYDDVPHMIADEQIATGG